MRILSFFVLLSALLSWSAVAATAEAGPPKIVLNPSGTGAGATGELKFKELIANGQNYTGFKAADALTADVMYTLPAADGTSGQALTTNGSKVLAWATVSIADGDKGDITVSGSGATFTIDNTAVTFAKIQNVATDRLVGRDTASSGSVEELTVGGGIEFTGSAGIQRSALTGDVTASAGSNSTTIANNAVTTAKILDANVTLAKLETRARPYKNFLQNGGFDWFQRGTLNATSTASSLEGKYYPDRWFWLTNAGGVGTPSYTNKRVDCSSEGAKYGVELGHSGGTNTRYFALVQTVESFQTISLRGRTVRFQSRIKQASSSATWKAVIINWTGSADTSLATNLVNNWASGTYTEGNFFTTNGSYDIAAVGADTSVGTSFTDVVVTGTVSSSANNLYVGLFCVTGNPTNATITKAGLFDGAEARDWFAENPSADLVECQRFYEKNFALDTAPADNLSDISTAYQIPGGCYQTGLVNCPISFKVKKRNANYAFSTYAYSSSATAGRWGYITTAGGLADFTSWANSVNKFDHGLYINNGLTGLAVGYCLLILGGWTVDNELTN